MAAAMISCCVTGKLGCSALLTSAPTIAAVIITGCMTVALSSFRHSGLDDMQDIDEEFRYTVIGDDEQCKWDKHHMGITPGAEDGVRFILCAERLCQARMVF